MTVGAFIRRIPLALVVSAASILPAIAQSSGPSQTRTSGPMTRGPVTFFVRNWTRVESWQYFEPKPGGGDPDYTDIANRLQFGLETHQPRFDVVAAGQYVQFGGLPTHATGPGPLGTGALYYDQSGGDTASHQLYLRYANVRLKNLTPGWSVQAGRMGYTSGAESPSGDPKIEAVKRQRVDSRLIGEFEWSQYQRGFDGVRTDFDRSGWHATASAFHPTQGGFANEANVDITDIGLYSGIVTAKPGALLPHTDWQAFAIRYDDDRNVRARPDNTGLPAPRVDVHISTFGTTLVGAYPAADGQQVDALFWFAGQTGTWYGQDHAALAVAGEAGVQWTKAPWRPWLRGGFTHASGDDNPADATHGTFFQVLPTVRKYSLSATYSLMNLNDAFVQLLATPRPPLALRVDLHRLTLASAADRWYFGSGATLATGTTFGYGTRASQGSTDFGTVIEGSADYRISPHWSVNGYAGVIQGGDVVARTFAGRTLTFIYGENVFQF